MNCAPRIGLLPCYLKLYDDHMPEVRADFDGLLKQVVDGFEQRGIAVAQAPVCRVAPEFDRAVSGFVERDVHCIVTLHLAYSPSLEAVDALARTGLPVVMLDTTMDASFGRAVSPDRIMLNHGIHGVMDLASVLRRQLRPFEIIAGHVADPQVLDGAADLVRAAFAAGCFRRTKALRVGDAFKGMGDFDVAEDVLAAKLGIEVDQIGLDDLARAVADVAEDDVAREVAGDRAHFNCVLPEDVHARSVRIGLGLRRILDNGGYGALSVNFQAFNSADSPANTMPFLEIAKAMARGIGYAGEGDVLTASLVGALCRAFPAATFTEIFCPDWAGHSLFLSHMGEISPTVAAGTPRIVEKPLAFGGGENPAVLTCAAKPGPAVFVNLAPGPDETFSLIVAPVEVLADTTNTAMKDCVRTWVRPSCPVPEFLEIYSRCGGTHHSALVLGEVARAMTAFARFIGVEQCVIG